MNLSDLAKEFPRDAVHWRAQTLTRDGGKALALTYLNARDVMDRFDEVCGPENWQTDPIETARGRIICRIGVRVEGEWVWKGDGAGETAVEGEKGAMSDALKRAAVLWGVGRYLYRMDAVWVPCETYERNGKKIWSKWSVDPWSCVRGSPPRDEPKEPKQMPEKIRDRIKAAISKTDDPDALQKLWGHDKTNMAMRDLPLPMQGELQKAYTDKMAQIVS